MTAFYFKRLVYRDMGKERNQEGADNILLQDWQTPYGAPPFHRIKEADYLPAFEAALAEARADIARIKSDPADPTFENTVVALDEAGHALDRISDVFFNLLETDHNEQLERISEQVLPLLTRYENDVTLDEGLFARVKRVYGRAAGGEAGAGLDEEARQLLEKTYRSFVRNGALLSKAGRETYRRLTEELSDLSMRFGHHVLKDRAAYGYVTADPAEVAGLPESLLAVARGKAAEKGQEGWRFDLSEPCYFPLMKQAACRDLRRRMYEARQRVGYRPNDSNNEAVVLRIAGLRAELARLLGHATYADYALENRMAETPSRVRTFLETLVEAALPAARRELAALSAFARQRGLKQTMQVWDVAFYAEQWRILHYNIEEETLRHYFALPAVRAGVFALTQKLYGLRFERVSDVPLYHPAVETYAVYDGKRFMGLLYMDFYARPSKQGGAWMTTFRGQSRPEGQAEVRPLVQLVFNFEPPRAGGDSLLTFSQVQTFLHEFGHGLHALLSDCRYGGLSGTRVPRDFVELPSQLMENWALEKPFLDLFARHDRTGEPVPADMVARLREAQRFMAGYNAVRQLSFATLDLAWHTLPAEAEAGARKAAKTKAASAFPSDVAAFERQAVAALELFPPVPDTNMSVQFSHIFSGGYAAGYYGYKWAEVLDADAFELFRENGLFDAATASRFREAVLSKGGSRKPMDLYVAFRGREPRLEALLKREGLLAEPPAAPAAPAAPAPPGAPIAPVSALRQAMQAEFAAVALANGPEKRRILQSFFKTGPGEYGEGDVFYGVTVPQTRAIAKRYGDRCTEADIEALLAHPNHEMRLCALLILKTRMQNALKRRDEAAMEAVYTLYRKHTAGINNWDLVDLSAPDIVGAYAFYRGKPEIFQDWVRSADLWEQRIAVVATYAFIRNGQAEPTFRMVDELMQHPHDLIHKACGWMLREVGKRVSEAVEVAFLSENDRFKRMPRTMLRYAIERFPEERRGDFLQKTGGKRKNGQKS